MELSREAIEALQRNKKVEAVKIVREQTGLGLKEAKDLVDAYEVNGVRESLAVSEARRNATGIPSAAVDAIKAGRTIEAIKIVREHTGKGLKEAKDLVDDCIRRDPQLARSDSNNTPLSVGGFGIVILIAALVVGYFVLFKP